MEYPVGTLMYRYHDCYYSDDMRHSELHVDIYVIVKKTKCGSWVVRQSLLDAYKEDPAMPHAWEKAKFVLEDFEGKRLCYPTLRMALQSYMKRKARQILLTTNTLVKARAMLDVAAKMDMQDLKLPAHMQPQTQEQLPW